MRRVETDVRHHQALPGCSNAGGAFAEVEQEPFRVQFGSIDPRLCNERTSTGYLHITKAGICQELLSINREGGEWNEGAIVTPGCRRHDIRVVGALAQPDGRSRLSRMLPGDARLGVVPLRDVNQFGETVDLSWIDRNV